MKIISIGNAVYLGEVEETKGGIVIKEALCLGAGVNPDKTHLAAYLKAKNIGKLEKDIEIKGQGVMYSNRPLSDDLELEYSILVLKLKQAEKIALPELVNKRFDELNVGR